ncbi:MAG TPA: response regulator [Opitutaceae bacterium]|jgi:CheY-like chemotaxis protein|nr:response regulator [Opitutaceae bacterium]
MSPAPVLYAEDSEDDAFLLQRAFTQAGVTHPLVVVPNGKAVVHYLSATGQYVDRAQHPFPRLVLLDIKMPHRTGLDVLCWIRQQPELRRLPVIILTSSAQDRDIASAYSLGANGYLVKPSNAAGLAQLGKDLGRLCDAPEAEGAWTLHGNRLDPLTK